MTKRAAGKNYIDENVVLANQITGWLRSAGVTRTEMAVDFADIISAAEHVSDAIRKVLKLRTDRPKDAEEALGQVAEMRAWLFTEMKPHLEELEAVWSVLEDRLEELSSQGKQT